MPERAPPNTASDSPIEVVLLTDQKYVQLTAVAMTSLVMQHAELPAIRLHITIVCIDVSQEGKSCLARALHDETGKPYSHISLNCHDHQLPANLTGKARWLQLVSLKMHLAEILPALERVIFLDSDIVALKDLRELWQTDLATNWLATVPCLLDDPGSLINYDIFPIKYQQVGQPINAGVLLLDLKKMRQQQIARQLADWQQQHLNQLKLPEQEAIAINFPQQWQVLKHEWNYRPYGEPCWTADSWDVLRDYLALEPAIVHFQGNVRPFDLRINLPYYAQWQAAWQRALPDTPQSPRKRLSYFQFVFFEYPDALCRIGRWLPRSPGRRGLIRFGLMIPLLGLIKLPQALNAYLRYRQHPDEHLPRIRQFVPARAYPASARNQ